MAAAQTIQQESSIRGNVVSLLTSLSCTLLVFGFSLPVTINLILLAVTATVIGAPLWSFRNRRSPVDVAEVIGAGCAIGFAIIGILGLLLRGHLLVLVLSAFTVVGMTLTHRDGRWNSNQTVPMRDQDLFALGATPLIAMIPFHPKIMFFVLPVVALTLTSRTRSWLVNLGNRGLAVVFSIFGISALVVYDVLGISRPWRDLIELDLLSDEANSFGLHAIGLSESFTVIGEPIRGHFLALSSHGTAARLFDLPAFVLVGGGGYALAICALALLVFSYAKREARKRSIGWLAIVLLLMQASVAPLTFVVPAMRGANALPMLWFAVAVILAHQSLDRAAIWDHIWIAAASVVVLLGKVHWGALFIAFVTVAAASQSLTCPSRLRLRLLGMVTIAALASYVSFLIFLSVADSELAPIDLRIDLLHGLLAVLLVRFLPALISIRLAPSPVMYAILAVLTVACSGYAILGPSLNLGYLFNGIGVLSALFAPLVLSRELATATILTGAIRVALTGIVLGLLVGLHHLIVIGELRYGSRFNLGLLEEPVVTSVVFIGLLGVLVVVAMSKLARESSRSLTAIAAIASISLSFGVLIALSIKPYVHSVSHSRLDLPREILLPEQLAIGQWLQNESKGDALVASNSLCRANLRLGERVPTNSPSNDCGDRNVNAWLPAVSHRRALIAAPVYGPLAFQVVQKSVQVEAYRASVVFGDTGDQQSLEVLREMGVDWFVVDIANSANPTWISQWPIAFQTQQYAVLNLASSR